MKRIVLPILLLFLFSSCTGQAKQTAPELVVDNSVEIRYMQNKYIAHIKTEQTGEMTSVIESPDTLKGITVICNTDGMAVVCGDTSFKTDGGYIPFKELYNALKKAGESEPVSIKENGEKIIYQYNDFSIETNSENNKIEHIDTKNCVYEMR